MEILFTDEIKDTLLRELESAEDSVQIITAYCKVSVLEIINTHINSCVTHKSLLVRFRLDDILKGATDFSICDFCKRYNWDLYINFNLHAKTYIVDNYRCLIGSANVSKSGLGLNQYNNSEIATLGQISSNDVCKINDLFKSSLFVSDTILSKLEAEFYNAKETFSNLNTETRQWSDSIMGIKRKSINVLFSHEFPGVYSPQECIGEYLDFLDCVVGNDITLLKNEFIQSNCYLWLINCLKENRGELYFGQLTQALHTVLINDPRPYRKDVKILLNNLLNWIVELEIKTICIDQPRHSQRIRMKI